MLPYLLRLPTPPENHIAVAGKGIEAKTRIANVANIANIASFQSSLPKRC